MKARFLSVLAALILAFPLMSQGIRDSVFSIRAVEIRADKLFLKEEAGMKQTVVDTAIIRGKVSLSLSDLLSENTSVFIKNHGRGALATASFRGTAASHTGVSWNGIPISSPMAGMVDFSLIPVYIIDGLSLKHGAASITDAGGEIGGSIHISNTADWDEGNSIRYMQGFGSYTTFDEFLKLGFGNNRVRIKTRLYHNFSKNDYTFLNRGIGNLDPVSGEVIHPLDTNENAAYLRYGLLQELHLRLRPDRVISVLYWGQYADRAIPRPTSYEGPDNSNLNQQADLDHRVVASWKYYASFGTFMLRSGYAGKKLEYTQLSRVPGLGKVALVHSLSRQHSLYNTLSYVHEPLPGLSLEGRLELKNHRVETRDKVLHTGYDEHRNEQSVFLAVRKSFADRLNLNLMVREEWVDGKRIPLIPFFGFDLRLRDGTDLLLKGSVARNYHLPTLNDLYWQPGGNPGLMPEQGFTLEGGLEFQRLFSGGRLPGGQKLNAGLTTYRSRIHDWILWVPSYRGYWEPVNIREVLSSGAEVDLHWEGVLNDFTCSLAGTYAYTRSVNHGDSLVWGDASYGKQLVYIPLHSGNLLLRFAYRDFYISYQYNAYSERFTTSSNDLARRDWLYPYFMNDVAAGTAIRIRKLSLTVELKVRNLFNETYHSILYRPMPGRNYYMLVRLSR